MLLIKLAERPKRTALDRHEQRHIGFVCPYAILFLAESSRESGREPAKKKSSMRARGRKVTSVPQRSSFLFKPPTTHRYPAFRHPSRFLWLLYLALGPALSLRFGACEQRKREKRERGGGKSLTKSWGDAFSEIKKRTVTGDVTVRM